MEYYDKVLGACGAVANNVAENLQQLAESVMGKASKAIDKISVSVVSSPPPPPPEPWIRRNKLALACGVGLLGVSAYYLYKGRSRTRVCAARAPDGGRQDVVVVVGSTNEPLVRVLVQELNLRSFIVYICTSADGPPDQFIQQQHCADIRALPVNLVDPASITDACHKMSLVLSNPVTTMQGGDPYYLNLAGIILIPDLSYPEGPLEMISQVDLETCIASKLVAPLFSLRCGFVELARKHHSRIVLANPSIIANLSPAYHMMESISTAALDNISLTMYRELKPQGIYFSQIKLGSFDVSSDFSGHHRQVVNKMRADILTWPEKERHIYAGSYLESSYLQTNRTKGSSLNELHVAVAYILTTQRPPRVVHVGRFSYAYEWLRNHLPEQVLTWALA